MEGPPPGIAAPVPPRRAAAAGDAATQRRAAALAAFDGAREGPKPAAPRRAFDTWRDLTRLRRLYAASKAVPSVFLESIELAEVALDWSFVCS